MSLFCTALWLHRNVLVDLELGIHLDEIQDYSLIQDFGDGWFLIGNQMGIHVK